MRPDAQTRDAQERDAGPRERMLRAARDLFARHGFAGVSMRMVAAQAGATKPALYYHFRDKESLFEECLTEFNADLDRTMREAIECPGSVRDRVGAVTSTLLTGSPFHPVRVHGELAEQMSGDLRRRLRSSFRQRVVVPVTDVFADLRTRGELRAGVEPEAAALALIGICMAFLQPATAGQASAWAPLPVTTSGVPTGSVVDVIVDLLLQGVAAAPVGARQP